MAQDVCICGTDERVTNPCGRGRKGRAPSKYNLFMRDCLSRKKGEGGSHTEKFRSCVLEWKGRR